MAAPRRVVQAVEAAIVASANLAALQHVSAAAEACQRLGRLSSGRWRSAARDLAGLEEDLQTSLSSAAETLASRAEDVGVPEDALWTVGDAAATLDLLRELALESLEEDDAPAARVLRGEVLFGASFVEDPELPDRGTTLLFGWPDPLSPAQWPWQANWIATDADQASEEDEDGERDPNDLDVFEVGELQGAEAMLASLSEELGCSRDDAQAALRSAATELTRASLLASMPLEADEDQAEAEDDDSER